MKKLKIISYLIREVKNTFEFFVIPFLAILLPKAIYYPLYKFICKHTFFYSKYSGNSLECCQNILHKDLDFDLWERNVKLLYLVDIVDFWLVWLRPQKASKQIIKKGNWQKSKGHLALGMHWGTGYLTLQDFRNNSMNPYFVYAEPQASFKHQSFIETRYRKLRIKHLDSISGSEAVATEGGYKRIQNLLERNEVPIILFDAPRIKKQSKYTLNVFNHTYKVASGFINLICKDKTEFQFYSVKLNFDTGMRELRISELNKDTSIQSLLNKLSLQFEELLLESPEQWFFWRQSDLIFEENSEQ